MQTLDIGTVVYDMWTRQLVTVVAGAQAEGYVTVLMNDGPKEIVAAIQRKYLEGLTYDQQLISEGKCPELVMYRMEDGWQDGRCLADIVPGGYACEGHTAEIDAWHSMSEEERQADEYNREMYER